jgi:hypothetical protein
VHTEKKRKVPAIPSAFIINYVQIDITSTHPQITILAKLSPVSVKRAPAYGQNRFPIKAWYEIRNREIVIIRRLLYSSKANKAVKKRSTPIVSSAETIKVL